MRTTHGIMVTAAGIALAGAVTAITVVGVTTTAEASGARAAPSAPPEPVAAAVGASSPSDAVPVKPHRRTLGTRKVRWTGAKPVRHGRYLRITWWSGIAPCTVLDHVKIRETAAKVVVTVYEGRHPAVKDTVCAALAVKKSTTVKLRSPLGTRKIVDGARS